MEYLNEAALSTPLPVILTMMSNLLFGFPSMVIVPDWSDTAGSSVLISPCADGFTGMHMIRDAPFSTESITASRSGLSPRFFVMYCSLRVLVMMMGSSLCTGLAPILM